MLEQFASYIKIAEKEKDRSYIYPYGELMPQKEVIAKKDRDIANFIDLNNIYSPLIKPINEMLPNLSIHICEHYYNYISESTGSGCFYYGVFDRSMTSISQIIEEIIKQENILRITFGQLPQQTSLDNRRFIFKLSLIVCIDVYHHKDKIYYGWKSYFSFI